MATAAQKATSSARTASESSPTQADLEADIARLREDIAALAKQIGATGGHSYAFAKRAAGEGAEQLRARGEAAVDALKANANDFEHQVAETVREKPLTSLAIAAGVGFIFALLTNR